MWHTCLFRKLDFEIQTSVRKFSPEYSHQLTSTSVPLYVFPKKKYEWRPRMKIWNTFAVIPCSSIVCFVWLKHVSYSDREKRWDLHSAAHNVTAALRALGGPTMTCSPAGQHMKWHPHCVTLYYHLYLCLFLTSCRSPCLWTNSSVYTSSLYYLLIYHKYVLS